MGSSNDLPNSPMSNSSTSEQLLEDIKQNLQTFQKDLVGQLTADVGRLQAEKVELLTAIQDLKREHKTLQNQHQAILSQQQLAQQKIWAKQLAEALANRLYVLLAQKIDQNSDRFSTPTPNTTTLPQSNAFSLQSGSTFKNSETQQALAVLNTKLDSALGSLQQDLNQQNSSIFYQLSQTNSAESQGEVLLDQLVVRLKHQFPGSPDPYYDSSDTSDAPYVPSPLPESQTVASKRPEAFDNTVRNNASISDTVKSTATPSPVDKRIPSAKPAFSPTAMIQQWAEALNLSQFQLGLILVLFSTMALSLHNVAVGIIGAKSRLFGVLPEVGGVINLMSLDSSLMLLWLRMIIVVPLMAGIATFLYPPAWGTIKSFFLSRDRKMLGTVIGSGGFLFLSQILIYIAIGSVGPGVAVTLLFMYPIVTVPLAWFFFNDRPTAMRWFVLAGVFFGIILTADLDVASFQPGGNASLFGIGVALLSGLFFACYLISMQLSFQKLHPVPVTVIQFFTIFVLTSFSLILRPAQADQIQLTSHWGLLIGALILGGLTLMGYLFNNFGIRYMGAARASIIAASGPALTAFLGWLMIPDAQRFQLEPIQWLGIVLVTVCVAALSLERLFMNTAPKSTTKAMPSSD